MPAASARLRAQLTGITSIASIPLPAEPGRPDQSGLDLSAAMFAPCSLGCRGTPRHRAALRGTRPLGLLYGPARHSMARHDAPLAQLAEQQTLNLRVRGSSPWRRTSSHTNRFPTGVAAQQPSSHAGSNGLHPPSSCRSSSSATLGSSAWSPSSCPSVSAIRSAASRETSGATWL